MNSKPISLFGSIAVFKKTCVLAGVGLSLILSACSVEQQEGEDPIAAAKEAQKAKPFSIEASKVLPRTSLGTRHTDAEPMDTDLDNALARWDGRVYEREPDYPGYRTSDLQYITLKGNDKTDAGRAIKGKKLAVRVSRPIDADGNYITTPLPVILTQTGYNTNLISLLELPSGSLVTAKDPYLNVRGYVTVSVDVLGTGGSEGGWALIDDAEQLAYLDTLDWVVDQEWSNGVVGVSGISYMGITGLLTAGHEQARGTNAIKAVFAMVPLGDAMRSIISTGGLINGVFMSRWMALTQVLTAQVLAPQLQFPQFLDLLNKVQKEHIDQIDYFVELSERALKGEDPTLLYDGAFWETRAPTELLQNYKVPTFIIGAHHDLFQRDVFLQYENIKKQNTATKLIIYKGDHITSNVVALAGRGGIPPAGNLILQWFDHYLKNIPEAAWIESVPNVTQETLNHHGYVASSDWPHPLVQPESWYLHGNMSLSKEAPKDEHEGNEMFAAEPAKINIGRTENKKYLHFDVEPQDGTRCSRSYVQWTLGLSTKPEIDPCYTDNFELEKDALNYETERLTEDYYFNGPILAELWIKSSVTDAVLSVRVDIVNQSLLGGTQVQPITNGLMLASRSAIDETKSRKIGGKIIQPWYPMSQKEEKMLVPGELRKVLVEIFPTSAVVKAGQKLRISIAPSNQAQGVLNNKQRAATNGGVTTIVSNKDHPSSILMPMVPRRFLN